MIYGLGPELEPVPLEALAGALQELATAVVALNSATELDQARRAHLAVVAAAERLITRALDAGALDFDHLA